MKPFEHTGFWWDPHHPETRWPGTLRFDPVTGALLTRTVTFYPSHLSPAGREFDILLGETTSWTKITLLDCFERDHSEIFANAVIVGFHAGEPDPPILIAAAVIERLDAWWGKRSIAVDPVVTSSHVAVSYTQPEPVEVHADAAMRTSILSGAASSFEHWRVSIHEEIRFELVAPEPRPLSVFRNRIHACQDLLSIAALTHCNVEGLRVVPPPEEGRPRAVGDYFAVPVFKDPAERGAEFLFPYHEIAPKVRDVFGAWLNNAERLSAVRSLYLSAAYGSGFLELKLLALAQAAEAFHRRMHEGQDTYMDPGEFERKVLAPLKAAIPNDINSSHRQSLRSRVTYMNEFSFKKRLTVLFKDHEAALRVAIPNPFGWINRIIHYRNKLTHHPVVTEQPSLNRLELIQCIYVLRILLELCFLRSMAMSAEEIAKLSARSYRYTQIRQRFFTPEK